MTVVIDGKAQNNEHNRIHCVGQSAANKLSSLSSHGSGKIMSCCLLSSIFLKFKTSFDQCRPIRSHLNRGALDTNACSTVHGQSACSSVSKIASSCRLLECMIFSLMCSFFSLSTCDVCFVDPNSSRSCA